MTYKIKHNQTEEYLHHGVNGFTWQPEKHNATSFETKLQAQKAYSQSMLNINIATIIEVTI